MNAALLQQIQGGKGLKKVPDSQKNDRSQAQAGAVVGAKPAGRPASGGTARPPMPKGPPPGNNFLAQLQQKQHQRAGGKSGFPAAPAPQVPSSANKYPPPPKPSFHSSTPQLNSNFPPPPPRKSS